MIRDRGVATRYAQALFGAAGKTGEEEAVLADLHSVELLYQHDPSFQEFLESPSVLTEHKEELIRTILTPRVAPLVVRFFLLMLEKKRIQHLPLVYEHYRRLVEERLGVVRARVITAVPLAPDLAEALQAKLVRLTGKKVQLDPQVDPRLIGGVVVSLGERTIDGSVRHRLDELRDQLLASRVRASVPSA